MMSSYGQKIAPLFDGTFHVSIWMIFVYKYWFAHISRVFYFGLIEEILRNKVENLVFLVISLIMVHIPLNDFTKTVVLKSVGQKLRENCICLMT
jgi:hypothetical protein